MLSRRGFVSAVAAAVAASVAPLHAQALVPEAAQFIRDLSQRAIGDLTATGISDAERARRFAVLLHDNFDVPGIGRFVLGRFWRIATEAERSEYLKLFEEYLTQIYAGRFKEYAGENLRIDQARTGSDDEVIISSTILRSQIGPTPVIWRARRDGGSFRVFDLSVEGVSLSITHRDDFAAVIQSGGGKVEALLKMLRAKVQQGRVV